VSRRSEDSLARCFSPNAMLIVDQLVRRNIAAVGPAQPHVDRGVVGYLNGTGSYVTIPCAISPPPSVRLSATARTAAVFSKPWFRSQYGRYSDCHRRANVQASHARRRCCRLATQFVSAVEGDDVDRRNFRNRFRLIVTTDQLQTDTMSDWSRLGSRGRLQRDSPNIVSGVHGLLAHASSPCRGTS
jgi:hypothetical protein